MTDVRNDCLNILIEVLENHKPLHLVIADYLNAHRELEGADRAFASRLVRGTVERKITLDYIIDRYSETKTGRMKTAIKNILRMGVYQLLYMNVPDSAACNEAVRITKKRKFGSLSGFVNAVLRNIARQRAEMSAEEFLKTLLDSDKKIKTNARLSILYSMPEWIVDSFTCRYGEEKTVTAFEYSLTASGTTICTVSSKIVPEKLALKLSTHGLVCGPAAVSGSFVIDGIGALDTLPEFADGLFFVQDASSTMAVNTIDFSSADRVLDICAAPGGKSMHAADLLLMNGKDGAEIVSCDVSERKVELIKQNVSRCGLSNVKPRINDATVFNKDFEEAFDVVICDVPCSGLGIIGRKPDIKYNISPQAQAELVQLQHSILENAVKYVRHGGQILFSTCTVNRAENEENVDFLKSLGCKCISSRQLLPGEIRTDGFFYAELIRR